MIKKIWAVYFSGTGTTEKMVTHVAKSTADKTGCEYEMFDFTRLDMRKNPIAFGKEDLVVLGTPVIAGRVPNLLLKYLEGLQGNGALGIPIVMYGCRSFDDALVELRNIMENDEFHTVAGGAFAAEHSMSEILGAGRPDAEDMAEADTFIDAVTDKLTAINAFSPAVRSSADAKADANTTSISCPPVEVDGNNPPGPYYKPRDSEGNHIDIRKVKPFTSDACDNCGLCANLCPLGSIDKNDCSNVTGICMKCCGCIKKCPKGAKSFEDPGLIYHKTDLENVFGRRRAENKWFI